MRHSLLSEKPLTLSEAAKIIPGRPCKNTLRRWCHRGFRGIKLRSFYSGNALCVTERSIEEFWAAINPAHSPAPTTRAHQLAEQKLDELGI